MTKILPVIHLFLVVSSGGSVMRSAKLLHIIFHKCYYCLDLFPGVIDSLPILAFFFSDYLDKMQLTLSSM